MKYRIYTIATESSVVASALDKQTISDSFLGNIEQVLSESAVVEAIAGILQSCVLTMIVIRVLCILCVKLTRRQKGFMHDAISLLMSILGK